MSVPLCHPHPTNTSQLQRETGRTRHSGVPPFSSMSQGRPPMHSVLSKLFWAPSPPSTGTMKFVRSPLLITLLTNPPTGNSSSQEADPGSLLAHRYTGDNFQSSYR